MRLSCRIISCSRVTSTRQPLAPIGWPEATLPPLTFTFSGSRPSSRSTATVEPLKASLISKRSTCLDVDAFFLEALGDGQDGGDEHVFHVEPGRGLRADGREHLAAERRRAFSSAMTTTAAAPSLMTEALPAVVTPSFLKAGFILASAS